ncbi:MAG: hypothetical protein HDS49_03000 [Bacteroides sp.]|nr:hypothetical protein [Bacteroides sp.]
MSSLRLLLALPLALAVAACANMGRPEGGPRDELPPVYVRSNPALGQLNFSGNKITVDFDENIALDDAMNKIVVSPAQKTTPAISSNGRRVTIELRDTLQPNTTYTVDFADAVKDLNEGNVLDGFAIDFSTGETLDSLCISGMVFEAETLEPAQGMLVGVYSNLSDTAITTLPLERITKTNQLGQFTLRNLKEGTYRVFALNDVNRDYHWDRSEDIAFYDVTVSPSSEPMTVTDTLVRANGLRDSLVTREATRFLPDDLLLTWFNEGYAAQYLKDYKRPERNKITFQFGAKADTLPILRLINTHRAGDEADDWSVLVASPTLDTLTYWITDTTLSALDSITLEARYQRTDTNDLLSWTTDTLRFNFREPRKKQEKKKKHDEEADTVPPPVPHTSLSVTSGNSQELNAGLRFTSQVPIARLDTSAIHLEVLIDTIWYQMMRPSFTLSSPLQPMAYSAPYDWEEDTKYRLTIDSAAVVDIYGLDNDKLVHEFTTRKSDDYSSVRFDITGLDSRPAIVQLMTSADKPVASAPVVNGVADVQYLSPGTYYAKLFVDSNGDGLWTTGSLLDSIQPEEVYYFPKKLTLKKNWTIEQSWDINELPIDQQKPREIIKNKPKRRKGERDEYSGSSADDEEEDPFFDDPFMNSATRSGNLINSSGYYDGTNRRY